MNKTVAEARQLVQAMHPTLRAVSGVETVLCPPATALMAVSEMLHDSSIGVGAQNMHWEGKGAFTGELAPAMVKELCKYVIIGHSERRAYFGETDESVNRKLLAAQNSDLAPIVCVGETITEYEANRTEEVVTRQARLGLKDLNAEFAPRLVVAYEPVWAIGTGKASTGAAANAVIKNHIRTVLANLYGDDVAQRVRVLYGGSVTASNAAEFFQQDEIDGALVGGASLKPEEFVEIVKQAAN